MVKHKASHQQRGEDARKRLMQAGIEAFSLNGYESASTRSIAEKADVNLGAITYYFGNKEGLYHAVAEHISTHLEGPQVAATIARIERTLETSPPSPEQALTLLHELFDGFITLFLSAEQPELWSRFVFRELMEPSSAFEIVNERVVKKTINPCSALIGRMLNKPSNDPECIARAFTLFGQILIFRTLRQVTLSSLGWETFEGDHTDLIRSTIHQQVDDALKSQIEQSTVESDSERA